MTDWAYLRTEPRRRARPDHSLLRCRLSCYCWKTTDHWRESVQRRNFDLLNCWLLLPAHWSSVSAFSKYFCRCKGPGSITKRWLWGGKWYSWGSSISFSCCCQGPYNPHSAVVMISLRPANLQMAQFQRIQTRSHDAWADWRYIYVPTVHVYSLSSLRPRQYIQMFLRLKSCLRGKRTLYFSSSCQEKEGREVSTDI